MIGRKLPRNYLNEVIATIIMAAIDLTIMCTCSDNQIILAIGSGILTGSIVGMISLTANLLRKRRTNLEHVAIIGIKTYSRLQWICRFSIENHSVHEVYKMLSELSIIVSISGELWFIKEKDRKMWHCLYSILSTIGDVEQSLIQYRLTTDNPQKCQYLEIDALNNHFRSMFEHDPELLTKLNDSIDWAIRYCSKSRF